ncbi:MAG: hypothetical protein R3D25_15795 [Geminicoccaceae bacterium]
MRRSVQAAMTTVVRAAMPRPRCAMERRERLMLLSTDAVIHLG